MVWSVELTADALKQLRGLDRGSRNRILRFLRERISIEDNPRRFGKALRGRFAGLWRYRVGPYRVVCQIEDNRVVVMVVNVGHRSDIYD